MNDKSPIQQIFASYADCQYLTGEAVRDDDGTELQSTAWLCENRFDDFLDELCYALAEAGVSREALMKVFLRHALRVMNENPDALHAGHNDNKNAKKLIDEIIRQCGDSELLRFKADRVVKELPVPLEVITGGKINKPASVSYIQRRPDTAHAAKTRPRKHATKGSAHKRSATKKPKSSNKSTDAD